VRKNSAGFYSGKPTNIDVYAIENGQVIQESQIRKIANGAFQIDFAAGKKVIIDPPRASAVTADAGVACRAHEP